MTITKEELDRLEKRLPALLSGVAVWHGTQYIPGDRAEAINEMINSAPALLHAARENLKMREALENGIKLFESDSTVGNAIRTMERFRAALLAAQTTPGEK